MLLRFFTNSNASAYLRGMAEEFGESTNSIRHELNNLSTAGYLVSREEGRTILYQANTSHPLYNEVKNLVHKYLGLDKLIDTIISRLGKLHLALIVGDYAQGQDSGTIELVLVGEIDTRYLKKLVEKATKVIHRKIITQILSEAEYEKNKSNYRAALIIWQEPGAKKRV